MKIKADDVVLNGNRIGVVMGLYQLFDNDKIWEVETGIIMDGAPFIYRDHWWEHGIVKIWEL